MVEILYLGTKKKNAQKLQKLLGELKLFNKKYEMIKEKDEIYWAINSKNNKENKNSNKIKELIDKKNLKIKSKKIKNPKKIPNIRINIKKELQKLISKENLKHVKTSFDVVGDIAIIEIDEKFKELKKYEKKIGELFLKSNNHIKTVLRKKGFHKGIFRTQKMKYLAGEKKKDTIHIENGIKLYLDVEKTYFSLRLAEERARINKLVKKGEEVLVMFSGAGPYICNIAKNTKANHIFGIEINPDAHKFAMKNLKLNKIQNKSMIMNGDVHKIIPKFKKEKKKFDRIIMPLPKTADEFLEDALVVSKKGTMIHFYDFLNEKEIPNVSVKKIEKACKKAKKKFKIVDYVKCGQHAPKVFRVCIDFKVLN